MITIPAPVAAGDLVCVVSLSGGKDSTATALALREAGVPFRLVFADTGWEADETYRHLDLLEKHLGPIARVGHPGGMVAKIKARAGFPARMQRWCTRELKIDPLRAWHDQVEQAEGIETVCVVGVRGGESEARARMLPWEDDEMWGGWMWRPLLWWSVEDVLSIHRRHGVPLNPLYHRGHNRVGCYPCIFASKEEIRLIAEHSPERIDAVRPGRYAHPQATFFQHRTAGTGSQSIDDVVAWSRTERGENRAQLRMFPYTPDPTGGCFRWGMCEPPVEVDT